MVTVDRLTSMTVFAKVASTRSFSGAARELGISQATASKHVQTLEDWLGVRLLHRTTRRVALTDVREGFFVQCSRILEDMETARSEAKPDAPVRGSMRITAPVVFGSTRLGPLVVDFLHLPHQRRRSGRLAAHPARLCALRGPVLSGSPWRASHTHGSQHAPLHHRDRHSRCELAVRWSGRANGGTNLR